MATKPTKQQPIVDATEPPHHPPRLAIAPPSRDEGVEGFIRERFRRDHRTAKRNDRRARGGRRGRHVGVTVRGNDETLRLDRSAQRDELDAAALSLHREDRRARCGRISDCRSSRSPTSRCRSSRRNAPRNPSPRGRGGSSDRDLDSMALCHVAQRDTEFRGDGASISSRRSKADLAGFDDDRMQIPLYGAQGRREACISRTDYRDIGADGSYPVPPHRRLEKRSPATTRAGGVSCACNGAWARKAQSFSTASASSRSVEKWKSGLVTAFGTGVPPKPFMPLRRSIQQTL
jgi:hypothetical protein